MGAGANPEIGRKSAEETRAELASCLENTDMLFITAGMGGGTGTGAAPIIADIAHEMGILTVAIVTKPFKFEGSVRMEQAEHGIEELFTRVDSLVVIPNENLKLVSEQKITLANAFAVADNVLLQAVQSIAMLIKARGLINVDFSDVKTIMKDAGYAHMAVGFGKGGNKVEEASRMAIQSPLLESSINGAMRVLVNVTSSSDLSMEDTDLALSMVRDAAHPRALIILGAIIDDEMEDELQLTIIATGFDKTPQATILPEIDTYSRNTKKEPVATPMPNFDTPAAPVQQQQQPAAPTVAAPAPTRGDDTFTPPFLSNAPKHPAPAVPTTHSFTSDLKANEDDADKFIKDIMNVFGGRRGDDE